MTGYSQFEAVTHEDPDGTHPCRIWIAPPEMDAMRSAFDGRLVTIGIQRRSQHTTVNARFEVAGNQKGFLRFVATIYRVTQQTPWLRYDTYRLGHFSGSYSLQTREGWTHLDRELWDKLMAAEDGNILVNQIDQLIYRS